MSQRSTHGGILGYEHMPLAAVVAGKPGPKMDLFYVPTEGRCIPEYSVAMRTLKRLMPSTKKEREQNQPSPERYSTKKISVLSILVNIL